MRFSESDFSRVFVSAILFVLGVVCGNCWGAMGRAEAQELEEPTPELAAVLELEGGVTPLQRDFALDVARTAVNEASLGASPRDVDIVYEASRSHGGDDATRLRWLRRHSACTNPRGDCDRNGVLDELDDEAARARPGNAGWTRELRWDDARPPSLVGRWRPIWWARVRDRALRRVLEDAPTGVCGVPIRTWGRRSDFRARPNLVPVECGAANLGGTSPAIIRRARRARLALANDTR